MTMIRATNLISKNINVSEERDGKNVFYTYNEFYERLKKIKKSHDKFNVYRKEKKARLS